MKYLFYAFLCILLAIIQTTFVLYFPIFRGCYDLFVIIVVFLGLYRNFRESIPVILLAGLLMDNMYNGPFGLYLTSYIWIYICIRWSSVYFNVRSSLFLIFAVAAGVLFENLVFISSFIMFNSDLLLSENILWKILTQFIWALFSGYFFIMLIKKAYNSCSRLFSFQAIEQNGHTW
uniref:Rod shape-determining protein MreD n=1 Tax=uncultured Desulfobacterium sp. TaxID=201089 RepID=E1YLG0_9BACT|nr:hypothetical protein N47_E44550 [uncultured Desulfobacterium sp.]